MFYRATLSQDNTGTLSSVLIKIYTPLTSDWHNLKAQLRAPLQTTLKESSASCRFLRLSSTASLHDYLGLLDDARYPVLLNSGETDQPTGSTTKSNERNRRFDMLVANPIALIELDSFDNSHDAQTIAKLCENHLSPDQQIPQEIKHLPFFGGVIGLISYHYAEKSKAIRRSELLNCPSQVGVYRWAVIIDHANCESWLVADAKTGETEWQRLRRYFEKPKQNSPPTSSVLRTRSSWQTCLSYDDYSDRFERSQQFIKAGDCYQLNLTRQFSAEFEGTPREGFKQLSTKINEPFSAYLEFDGGAVISFSPERFIRIEDRTVLTEPIKGTRKRSSHSDSDQEALEELRNSEKDRAENLMIVDLMRNDLGRHCETGSVTTPQLFAIESYSNVHHLVSQVQGVIRQPDLRGKILLFLECLPGGSITGAPKRRAMQILAELEPHDRACYCGSLFYLSSNGNLDSNILIRTLLFDEDNKKVYCWGGGGIVADSKLETEYQESYYKISHILEALRK